MCRPFKFLLFILATQRYRSVDCYAPGGLIWSRNLQKFIPIANVSTFAAYEQEIVAKSRKKEEHNFQGKVLKLGYFEDYNMVNFIDDDTKITGVCGEIWNTLADYSNFTLKTIKAHSLREIRGNRRGSALGMIFRNKTQIIPRISFSLAYLERLDLTTPIWHTRYRIYIQPEWKSDANWIFNMFEHRVWCTILFFFLLLSVLGYLMQNISIKAFDDKKSRHNLHDHLFYTFATLCSQGFIPDTLDRRSKIFGVSKKIFAWLLLIVLSSHVISHMTSVKLHPPFEDFESLLNKTDRKVVIYGNSIAADQYWMLADDLYNNGRFKGPRVLWSDSQELLHKTICQYRDRKLALFELEDTKQAFGNRFCEVVAVGKSYFPIWVTFGVSKGFKYKRTFDVGILKMKEFGLIDRLKNRWLTSAQTVNTENLVHAPFTPVNLYQVLMLFVILSIGIVASAIIFVLEVIISIYKNNQPRPVGEEGLIGKAALNARHLPTHNYKNNRTRPEIELSEVSTRPIYVQNIFVVDPNYSRAQDNEFPHSTFYNQN